jgi:hypothetical protein
VGRSDRGALPDDVRRIRQARHVVRDVEQDVDGDTAYIVWKAETADNRYELGTDTFVVKDGKIAIQTFAGKISPKH